MYDTMKHKIIIKYLMSNKMFYSFKNDRNIFFSTNKLCLINELCKLCFVNLNYLD